jgi:hypothetical protein
MNVARTIFGDLGERMFLNLISCVPLAVLPQLRQDRHCRSRDGAPPTYFRKRTPTRSCAGFRLRFYQILSLACIEHRYAVGRHLEFVDDVEAQRDLAIFAEINKWPLHSVDNRVGPIPTQLRAN